MSAGPPSNNLATLNFELAARGAACSALVAAFGSNARAFCGESAKSVFQNAQLEEPLPVTLAISSNLEMFKRQVVKRLEERQSRVAALEAIEADLTAVNSTSKSQVEIERGEAEIAAIEAAIELVVSGREIENFEEEVAPLQLDYAKVFPEAGTLSFEGRQPSNSEAAVKIVMEFADVAERYYPLDVHYDFSPEARVCSCGRCLDKGDDVCPNCQFPVERETSTASPEHKDPDNEAKENFKRELYRCQGKIHNHIPPELYDSLDLYFCRHRIPIGQMVREHFALISKDGQLTPEENWYMGEECRRMSEEGQLTNEQIQRRGQLCERFRKYLLKRKGKNLNGDVIETSVKTMIEALRKTKNPGYYCDVHYICQQYWGWRLPDLADLEDVILNHDYNEVQREYNKLMRAADGKRNLRFSHFEKRKSNVSCRFRLYYHLRGRLVPCSEEDFKLVTLDHLQMEYRKLLREVFANAGFALPKDD